MTDTQLRELKFLLSDSRVDLALKRLVEPLLAEFEENQRQLHRFQHGQEIESDYLCKSDLELLHLRETLKCL